jgi:hypothetical protein
MRVKVVVIPPVSHLRRRPALRCETDTMDLQALGAVELEDPAGAAHRLGSYWEDRPVVLVFLRHFG